MALTGLKSREMELTKDQYSQIIDQAIVEDLSWGDCTTNALIPETQRGTATIRAKANGVLAGIEVARQVFVKVDPELKVDILIKDGNVLKPGDAIARIEGKIASLLKAERTALNFLQHLSGIATETASYVETIKGLPAKIVDTRKTIPGLRALEKYAVLMGGGKNHRMHLGDGILIKDNHLKALRRQGLSIKEIVAKARAQNTAGLKIEVEAKSPEEAVEAADAGADIVMLDNMSLADMRKAVGLIKGRCLIEASGGVNLDRLRAIAETGVDIISAGALTHSPKALDINMKLD
jgi:nicotinate-nucleotide pyrophosphorylase (carboxylating)